MENGDLASHPGEAPVAVELAKHAILLDAPGQPPQTAPPILDKEIAGDTLHPEPLTGTLLHEAMSTAPSNYPTQDPPHPLETTAPLWDTSILLPPTSDPEPHQLHLVQQQEQVSPKASIIQNMPDINTPANETISMSVLRHDSTNDNTPVDDQTILEQLQPVTQANNTDQRLAPDSIDVGDTMHTRQRSATRPPLTLNTSSETFARQAVSSPIVTPKIMIDREPTLPTAVSAHSNQHHNNTKGGKNNVKSVSALTSLLAAEKAHRSPVKKRPAIQHYHTFGNMGALYPKRSFSSNAVPTTTVRHDSATSSVVSSVAESPSESADSQAASSPYDSEQQTQDHHNHHFHRPHFDGLSKSLSMGKTGKTGFSARLKNLRQKHGSMNHEGFTSGESDSEFMQDASLDALSAPRKKIRDPTLPPLPMRFNSSASNSSITTLQPPHTPSIGTPYGYGSMGVAPLSISTKFIGTALGHHSSSAIDLRALRDHPRDRDLPRDSSTTRLKEMIKRNVGLSSPASTASLNSATAITMGAGDVLDDLQPYQNRFKVSRLTGRTKRRELSRSRASGNDSIGTSIGTTLVTSDEDEDDAPLTIPSRQHRYSHLFHRHDRQALPGREGKEAKVRGQEEHFRNIYAPSVSRALQEARAGNNDPNTLLAELEPLPPKFIRAFAALKHGSRSPVPSVNASIATAGPGSMANKITGIPPLPVLMYALPAVAPGSGYAVGGGGQVGGGRGSPFQKSALTTATLTSGGMSSQSLPRPPRGRAAPEKPVEPTPLCTKAFLFKSYLNSRPQGHYLFRIVQDRVEYGKLPVTKESCCSQYFRQADVTYRSLEKKYKLSKDAKDKMLAQHQQEWAERRRLSKEERFQPLRSTLDKNMTTVSEPVPRRTSVVASEGYGTDNDHVATKPKTTSLRASTIRGDSTVDSTVEKERSLYMPEASRQPGPVRVLLSGPGDSRVLIQSPESDAPSLAQQGSDIVANTHEGRRDSDLTTERSLTPELPPTPPPEISVTPPSELSLTPSELSVTTPSELSLTPPEHSPTPPLPRTTSSPLTSISLPISEPQRPFVPPKKDSVTNLPILTYEQVWQEAQMQAIDDAYWYRLERDRCLEATEVLYGLDLYLGEITRQVEYERFEAVAQTGILNENRDTTLFTITNGDRTNMMWLESPSLKLKNEFMNWFAIALMGRGEPEVACSVTAEGPGETNLDTMVERSSKPPTKGELKQRDADTLVDLTTVKLTLLEKQITEKRQQMCDEMKQIEDTLDRLDRLDVSAKNTATALLNAIESREIQLALQPSMTTGLTLAETVLLKLKEVDDRIVACTKVMGAARLNLNRLRYEIELEQRSIRHFRQYKILIAVVTLTILAAIWVLFHRRQVMASASAALEAVSSSSSSSGMSVVAPLPQNIPCQGKGQDDEGEQVSLFSKWNPRAFLCHGHDVGSPESDDQALKCPSGLL